MTTLTHPVNVTGGDTNKDSNGLVSKVASVYKKAITYADVTVASGVTTIALCDLPSGAQILDAHIKVGTQFNQTVSASIGITGTTDKYGSSISFSAAAGKVTPSLSGTQATAYNTALTADTQLNLYVTSTTLATAGALTVYITFI